MVNVESLDPADDVRFARWYEALRSAAAAGRHAPIVTPAAALRSMLLDQERGRRHAFGVFDQDRCLGAGMLERDTEQNTHLSEVEICVPTQHRRRGIGTALVGHVHDLAAAEGLTTLLAEVHAGQPDWPGLHFAERHGFAVVNTENRLVLDLPIAEERLDELAAVSDAVAGGYALTSWSGPTPADLREALAALQTRMNVEVPSGERDADPEIVTADSLADGERRLAARGYHSIRTLASAPDGEPAGYSHLFALQTDPENAIQDDTYVLTPHRGRRLGTLLKAANLRTLQRDRPTVRHVHTWTAELNDPMQLINADFGFRSVEIMHEVQYGSR